MTNKKSKCNVLIATFRKWDFTLSNLRDTQCMVSFTTLLSLGKQNFKNIEPYCVYQGSAWKLSLGCVKIENVCLKEDDLDWGAGMNCRQGQQVFQYARTQGSLGGDFWPFRWIIDALSKSTCWFVDHAWFATLDPVNRLLLVFIFMFLVLNELPVSPIPYTAVDYAVQCRLVGELRLSRLW